MVPDWVVTTPRMIAPEAVTTLPGRDGCPVVVCAAAVSTVMLSMSEARRKTRAITDVLSSADLGRVQRSQDARREWHGATITRGSPAGASRDPIRASA